MIPQKVTKALQSRLFIGFLYAILSAYVFSIWVWSADSPTTSFNGDTRSKLSGLIYGTAHKPYVQRALIPFITRTVYGSIPLSTWDALESSLLSMPKVQKETARLGWETEFLSEYLIALIFAFLSLLGFCFAIRKLWSTFYEVETNIPNLVPVIAVLCLPPLFPTGPHYIYDFPALFLFTAGLATLLGSQWMIFYPVFILGCFNKETTVLLSFVFVTIFYKHMSRSLLAKHLVAQLIIFGIVKSIIVYSFASNPGSTMDFHLYLNLHILLTGYGWATLFVGTSVLISVFYDFEKKHPALRQSALIVLPLGALVLWGGIITELRAVYEFYPIALVLILHTVFFSIMKMPYSSKRLFT